MGDILVVDDERIITRTLTKLLEKEGYSVTAVNSGEEAVDKVKQEDFRLIITDIRMPNMDGIQTAKKITQITSERSKDKKPVIFITGYADEKSRDRAQEFGYKNYVYKPFDLKTFVGQVKDALR